MRYVCFLILVLLSPIVYGDTSLSSQLEKNLSDEPDFSEIIKIAAHIEKLDLKNVDQWERRSRKAPWLPALSFGYDRTLRQTDSLSISDNISVSSDNVTIGPSETDLDESAVEGDVFRVRAVWSLDELVFSPKTLDVSGEVRELFKSRLQLSDYLFKIYSKRRELLAQYLLVKGGASSQAFLIYEQISVLTDQLDAWTEGHFHSRWWRKK